jgi:endonuclease/exonuclease/phosphatase (EEP) superfamily protein YafD
VVAATLLALPAGAWTEPSLAMLVALTPVGAVAAVGAAGLGACRRRWGTVAIAVLLTAGHLQAQGLLAGPVGRPAAAVGPGPLRVTSANLLAGNDRLSEALERLRSTDADVLLLQEVDDDAEAAFRRSGLLDRYPHHLIDARPGYFGSAILSRRRLWADEVIAVAGWPMTAATVDVDGRPLRLVNVHAPPPLDGGHLAVWSIQMEEMSRWAGGSELLLMGDFNATRDHAQFRRLLDRGFSDGLDLAGWAATWPADRLLPPVLRIDHALVDGDLTSLGAGTFTLPGSDHRGVTIALTPDSGSRPGSSS